MKLGVQSEGSGLSDWRLEKGADDGAAAEGRVRRCICRLSVEEDDADQHR